MTVARGMRSASPESGLLERLGPGLLVVARPEHEVLDAGDAPAPPRGGVWLHLGEGGATLFTGKADVGQGTRQAFARLVALELGVAASRVRVVMGDTDCCPWDAGTFGSLSTPTLSPLVRAAARRAREARGQTVAGAIGRARLEVIDAGSPGTAEGAALPPEPEAAALPDADLDPVAVAMVTGAHRYGSDLRRPGMLYGKLLRPPAYGATRRSLDVSRAERLPGVQVVVEEDLVGVVAPSSREAERALKAVFAEWELAPQPSEAEIEGYLRAHPAVGDDAWAAFCHEEGDVDAELERSNVRQGATYYTAYVAHVPLECRCALAEWSDGGLRVWVGTQRPFDVRLKLSEVFALDESEVQVIVPPTGAGFGGKHTAEVAVSAARLARASGRPVRLAYTREEEFAWAYFRPLAIIDVACGAGLDGSLQAWAFENVNAGGSAAMTPYRVPHQRVVHVPCVSPVPQGSYRALAATANCFARESQMDELAHRTSIDPLELRLRHLDDARLADVFRAAAERARWSARSREPGRGYGIAGGIEKAGRVAAVAEVCADVELGGPRRIWLERLTIAFECGAIVHPDELEKQVVGATIMGLGGALFEAVRFEHGRVLNPALSSYRVPRFSDVPQIDVVLVDRPDQPSAGGGETPIMVVAPALANALFDATGTRPRRLPLNACGFEFAVRSPAP